MPTIQRERRHIRSTLVGRGLSNREIGQALFISETTVKTHVTRLLQKLDLRDRAQAIVLAYQSGLFDAPETLDCSGGEQHRFSQ